MTALTSIAVASGDPASVAGAEAVTSFADAVEEWAFSEFVRLHVAGGVTATDTVAGYLREARLFRDRFLPPRGLALAALTEDDIVAYRRQLVEVGYAATTIATKLSSLRRLLDAAVRAGALAANVGAPRRRAGDCRDERLSFRELEHPGGRATGFAAIALGARSGPSRAVPGSRAAHR